MSEEVQRINNMDEQQILLKARNFKRYMYMTNDEYRNQRQAIIDRLSIYGYDYVPACCGKYNVQKRS